MRGFMLAVAVLCATAHQALAQPRAMRPDDLFRFARIGAIAWSPDGRRAAVEIHQPSLWLTSTVPTAQIAIVEAASAQLRTITAASPGIIGFFGPSWSPDNRQLLFFSVDTEAVVRVW